MADQVYTGTVLSLTLYPGRADQMFELDLGTSVQQVSGREGKFTADGDSVDLSGLLAWFAKSSDPIQVALYAAADRYGLILRGDFNR